MTCVNCTKTKPIPSSMLELVIGKIADVGTNVYVNFNNITRGQLKSYDTTSTSDGTVKLNVSNEIFPENHSFEISITDKLAGTIKNISIGGIDYACLMVEFEKQHDESNEIEIAHTHTIAIAD